MVKILRITAFKDNYIWLLFNPHNHMALVVDPGNAKPVLNLLEQEKLQLIGILITHHHWDHTGGVLELVEKTQAPVYGGANEPIPGLTHPLREGDVLYFKELDLLFEIIDIPGHTLGHIAYYCANINTDIDTNTNISINSNNAYAGHPHINSNSNSNSNSNANVHTCTYANTNTKEQAVFTGDTLFTAGCGRLFEGTAEQMLSSLTKLKSLPPSTQVYCGHEYTLSNLQFAKQVEPENFAIEERVQEVQTLRAKGLATVPAPLSIELETNPFLRTEQPNVIKSIEQHFNTIFNSKSQIFLAIRQWKDHF